MYDKIKRKAPAIIRRSHLRDELKIRKRVLAVIIGKKICKKSNFYLHITILVTDSTDENIWFLNQTLDNFSDKTLFVTNLKEPKIQNGSDYLSNILIINVPEKNEFKKLYRVFTVMF